MAKPVVIIVPGGWHVPAHFDYVRKELESSGYTVAGVNLASIGYKPVVNGRLATVQDDVDAVRSVVLSRLDAGQDVVVVGHSYGTVVGSAALSGLSTAARTAAGHSSSVKAFVCIAGFVLPPGTTLLEHMGGSLPLQFLHDKESNTTLPFAGPGAIEVLYHDLDHLDQLKAVHKLVPQSYEVNTSKLPDQRAALEGITVSCLTCSDDHAVPWEWHLATVKGFRERNEVARVQVSKGGHSPFIRFPRQTADFIRLAAGEQVETGWDELAEDDARSE